MRSYYIAICFGYWGRGDDEETALKNLRKAGGSKKDKTTIYRIDCEADKDAPFVYSSGTMVWYGDRTKVAEYTKGKRMAVLAAVGAQP